MYDIVYINVEIENVISVVAVVRPMPQHLHSTVRPTNVGTHYPFFFICASPENFSWITIIAFKRNDSIPSFVPAQLKQKYLHLANAKKENENNLAWM